MPKRKSVLDARQEVAEGVAKPRKALYRQRAHSNPLNDSFFDAPASPDAFDWGPHFPEVARAQEAGEPPEAPSFVDVGCGFGGLLLSLSPLFPTTLMVGFEIRDKVSLYVRERIKARRQEQPGAFGNVTCLRSNTQRYLTNYFRGGQLQKLFFLFPDPHFKVQNHRRRIVTTALLAEYAYLLAPGGCLYTATDVQELGEWMQSRLDAHPLFERLSPEKVAADAAAGLLTSATEEGQKVARNEGQAAVAQDLKEGEAGGLSKKANCALQVWTSVHRRRPHVLARQPG